MWDSELDPVVIDNGSGMCIAGFAGDETPKAYFPSIVGKPKPRFSTPNAPEDCFVGKEAQHKRVMLNLTYPMREGVINNWEDMEKIWNHVFYAQLKVSPEDRPVFLTEAPLNPKIHREKMAEVMFETFKTPAVYVGHQGLLSLFSSGRTEGIVLESGDGVTCAVPVYEGRTLLSQVHRMDFAGWDVTDYLLKVLEERGYELATPSRKQIAGDIKENLCRVALDFEAEVKEKVEEKHKLPDGEIINVGNAMFKCPEILFRPSLGKLMFSGVHEIVHNSIMDCDKDLMKTLYANIVISGGNTMFPGFADRMKKEIESLPRQWTKVKVVAPSERKFSTWIGGAILASLSPINNLWISKGEYEESGHAIVHRECS